MFPLNVVKLFVVQKPINHSSGGPFALVVVIVWSNYTFQQMQVLGTITGQTKHTRVKQLFWITYLVSNFVSELGVVPMFPVWRMVSRIRSHMITQTYNTITMSIGLYCSIQYTGQFQNSLGQATNEEWVVKHYLVRTSLHPWPRVL